MVASSQPVDSEIRRLVAQPTGNWVIRAPAGSGKTTLLVTRYLELLSRVEKPEEILAITFTRKATAEMRERILSSLQRPNSASPSHLVEAAQRARKRSLAKGWEIVANPSRLKIQTIESFRRSLVEASPVEAEIAPHTELVADARSLYTEAITRAFRLVKRGDATADCLAELLALEGNNQARVRRQLVDMLGKRDQWSSRLYSDEGGGQRWLRERMHGLWSLLEPRIQPKDFARLVSKESSSIENLLARPDAWRRFATLCLTKAGELRKRPPPTVQPQQKPLLVALLRDLGEREAEMLRGARLLPDLTPPPQEQSRLSIIKACLEFVHGQLLALFEERGTIDLVELGFGATRSLGNDETPTDLIIALDYSIRHILVDEFQDTSVTQSEFLHSLIREWMPGDDRSFFAVGDPMQSIYGFREAEVGLFSLAEQQGMGRRIDLHQRTFPLRAASLKTNFRSQQLLVDWVNRVFPKAIGSVNDTATGAVRFEPAVAMPHERPEDASPSVETHFFRFSEATSAKDSSETRFIAARAKEILERHPKDSLAILLRTRTYTAELFEALREKRVAYQGSELDRLRNEPVVLDMLSLAKSIACAGDRLANFALMRGPAAGLSLASLHRLSGELARANSLARLMQDSEFVNTLPPAEHQAMTRLVPLLSEFRKEYGRSPPRALLERAWIKTGLAAAYSDERSRRSGESLLSLVEDQGFSWIDFPALESALDDLYAPSVSDARLHLLTIHQAKGLEFDHVILPFTTRTPRSEERPPLRWRQTEDGLLAATRHGAREQGSAYEWLEQEHKTRLQNEAKRVLYVAVTRAKKSLCLTGSLPHASMQPTASGVELTDRAQPQRGALIAPIWSSLADDAFLHLNAEQPLKPSKRRTSGRAIKRLPEAYRWQPRELLPKISLENALALPEEAAAGEASAPTGSAAHLDAWAVDRYAAVGTVIHEGLRWLAEHSSDLAPERQIERMQPLLKHWLAREWIDETTLQAALKQASRHLVRALRHKDCQWILRPRKSAQSERDFTAFLDNRLLNVRVDRTFIEDGTRYIVDYKTSRPRAKESRQDFRERQVREHRPQLQAYARVFKELGEEAVEAALFLTSTPELVRVALDETQ